MKGVSIILTLLFVRESWGFCTCYQQGNFTGSKAPLNNAFSSDDFSGCYSGSPCEYYAYSGSQGSGWGTLSLTFYSIADNSATLQIFDGDSNTAMLTITPQDADNSGKVSRSISSTTPVIRIRYTQTSTSANIYYGNIESIPGLATTTIAPTTTFAPTTRSYNSSDFHKDPFLISHDLLIVVNPRTSLGSSGLNMLNAIATSFVNQLSVTLSNWSNSQSRLGLVTLTPYSPYYATQGQIWNITQSDFISSLPKSGISIDADIDSGLKQIAAVFFNDSSETAPTRANVQKTLVLLTADWPSTNANLSDDVRDQFYNYGANLAVIGYNLSSTADQTLSNGVWYNYKVISGSDNSSIASFVNPFFFNYGEGNNWCRNGNDIDDNSAVFEPFNYAGPCNMQSDLSCDNTWDTSVYIQGGRYCDFQNRNYKFYNPHGHRLKIVVYYELETDQDFLDFYADGVKIERFTGIDVNGATFLTRAKVLEMQFTTDNKGVYRGFYVQINKPF